MFGPLSHYYGAGAETFLSTWYYADQSFEAKTVSAAADRYKLLTPNVMQIDVGGESLVLEEQATLDLSVAGNWDTADPTDYTTAANRAGLNFYIYVCQPTSGSAPTFKLSANSTVPSGYTANNSRKVAGFHCLCLSVGTISGHSLTGYVTGDILPKSIWDLKRRPHSNAEGMVFAEELGIWVDIYLPSGTGASTASVYGGTISDTRNWMDFTDDGSLVKKRMLYDAEFQIVMEGSNQKTNITGSADPGTTGAHVDTAARRMISNLGVEDGCGVMAQYLQDQSAKWDFIIAWGWKDVGGNKGSIYTGNGDGSAGTADVKIVAGGAFGEGAVCGSRSRGLRVWRYYTDTTISARFCSRNINK